MKNTETEDLWLVQYRKKISEMIICQVYTEENDTLLSFKVSIHVSVRQLKIPVEEMQR